MGMVGAKGEKSKKSPKIKTFDAVRGLTEASKCGIIIGMMKTKSVKKRGGCDNG
jgi:hypothetical protein